MQEVWRSRAYLPEGRLPAGATVVDIGAHVGVFATWAATRASGVRVIAVEPSAEICRYLRRNLDANALTNVVVENAACAGMPGTAVLYRRGPAAMNSLFARDVLESHFVPEANVSVRTLDEIFARHQVRHCDLLKLDCEGAEYDILFNAAENTLAAVSRISLEYHVGLNDHHPSELSEFLADRGFRVLVDSPTDPEGGYLYGQR